MRHWIEVYGVHDCSNNCRESSEYANKFEGIDLTRHTVRLSDYLLKRMFTTLKVSLISTRIRCDRLSFVG